MVRDKRKNATYRTRTCKTCSRAKDRDTLYAQPDPRRYLARNWNALCRQRRNKGIYVCPELFGIQGVDYLMELWEHQGGRCALTGVAMTWVSMPIEQVRAGHGLGTSISVDRIENDKRVGIGRATCGWCARRSTTCAVRSRRRTFCTGVSWWSGERGPWLLTSLWQTQKL